MNVRSRVRSRSLLVVATVCSIALVGCAVPEVQGSVTRLAPDNAVVLITDDGVRVEVPSTAVLEPGVLSVNTADSGHGVRAWDFAFGGAVLADPLHVTLPLTEPPSRGNTDVPVPLVMVQSLSGDRLVLAPVSTERPGVTVESVIEGRWELISWPEMLAAFEDRASAALEGESESLVTECANSATMASWGSVLALSDAEGITGCIGLDTSHQFYLRLTNTRSSAVSLERSAEVRLVSDADRLGDRIRENVRGIAVRPSQSDRRVDLLLSGETVDYLINGFAERHLTVTSTTGSVAATVVQWLVASLRPLQSLLEPTWEMRLITALGAKECLGGLPVSGFNSFKDDGVAAAASRNAFERALECLPDVAPLLVDPATAWADDVEAGIGWLASNLAAELVARIDLAARTSPKATVTVQQGIPKLEAVDVSRYGPGSSIEGFDFKPGEKAYGFTAKIDSRTTVRCGMADIADDDESYKDFYSCRVEPPPESGRVLINGPFEHCPWQLGDRGVIANFGERPQGNCHSGMIHTDLVDSRELPVGSELSAFGVTCQRLSYGVQCFERSAGHGFLVTTGTWQQW